MDSDEKIEKTINAFIKTFNIKEKERFRERFFDVVKHFGEKKDIESSAEYLMKVVETYSCLNESEKLILMANAIKQTGEIVNVYESGKKQ